MVRFGLVGRGVSHSFSPGYFNSRFLKEGIDARYSLYDLKDIDGFPRIIELNPDLRGLNVTSPYKREVIKYLDELSPEAESLEAVNVIEFKADGKLKGYNTDMMGFMLTLYDLTEEKNISDCGKKALIMGTGGAAAAIALALQQLGWQFKFISRKAGEGAISYGEMNRLIPMSDLIINATPVGLPGYVSNSLPVDYSLINSTHFCYDLNYFPSETIFLKKAREAGARIKNGKEMLFNQARLTWDIWMAGLK